MDWLKAYAELVRLDSQRCHQTYTLWLDEETVSLDPSS